MKVHKIHIDKADANNPEAAEAVKRDFIEFTHQFGYEGDSIYQHQFYHNGERVDLFNRFLTELGFCSYYGKYRRNRKNVPYVEYYTRNLKKIALFRLKYSL